MPFGMYDKDLEWYSREEIKQISLKYNESQGKKNDRRRKCIKCIRSIECKDRLNYIESGNDKYCLNKMGVDCDLEKIWVLTYNQLGFCPSIRGVDPKKAKEKYKDLLTRK